MTPHENTPKSAPGGKSRFATTHWSLVVSAGRRRGTEGGRSSEAVRALAALCENYWFPLYAFVRRTGRSADDAQDLTQEFFVRLLTENFLAAADPDRGRFRSFLLGAMKHFLANQRRRQAAAKRGGLQTTISLDFIAGEARYHRIEPADHLTPERLYENRWAMTLLDLMLGRLCEEFHAAGKLPQFDALKQFLVGPSGGANRAMAYSDVARRLDMTEGAVKVAVHRLRRRYRKLLEEEIVKTLDTPDSLEDELNNLLAALSFN